MWVIERNLYDQNENDVYETLFTLANGYVSFRGVEEFSNRKIPGTYLAGVFDKSEAQVTELVNLPDPLGIRIYVDNEPLLLELSELLYYDRKLNMKSGVLESTYIFETSSGKKIDISSKRFVSRKNRNRFAIKYTIKPLNFSGSILIENYIDNRTYNGMLDPTNKIQHYQVLTSGEEMPGILSLVRTFDRGHVIAFRTALKGMNEDGENILKLRKFRMIGQNPCELFMIFVDESREYTLEKFGTVYSSRESCDPLKEASLELARFYVEGLESELNKHTEIMNEFWNRSDIQIKDDETAQKGIRFNIFHLYQCVDDDPTVSIGARGLHGEGYKGHVFWDTEIFMFPFFLHTLPEYAKNLLLYRYNTLKGARKNAELNGYEGAQYPWESADDGLEVTPKWGQDYLGNPVRIWTGDEEFHINSDIAVALIHYFMVTGDEQFMKDYGVEILLETGRFWASRVEYNEKFDRYEINRVIGPDEFHEHVNNNVYTNYLAKWNLTKAREFYYWLEEKDAAKFEILKSQFGFTKREVENWQMIAEKIYIPRNDSEKLIEQFEGYFNLKEYEITEWDENGLPKWPKGLDLTKLGETKLIKQPDVVMLMLVLPEDFSQEEMRINYKYYEKRTMHKSSLSPSMYSIMGLKVGDTHNAYKYFMKTLLVDLEDNQGNTNNGFHAASAGGAWQCVVNGFGGMTLESDGILSFSPWLPKNWEALSFNLSYKGSMINVRITKEDITFATDISIKIRVRDKVIEIPPGRTTIGLSS
ncbi:MAG TPA: glycosyl hydrolase family 65 protein [Fervidobacterium sp.]|nr:glycosyl hydrolase family 65 protein [Fervidobacterium sp.]HPT53822.1 glycosyl hydrolase family 65 protein [Fervidobacterium sp.]HPZ17120.1 glycosyl hydrolase family 65 protein [Fervidobacterium sp.]HQE48189.1 glycosyl hydrolase family 65 protein [Fervidobacterium sp.]HRD20790.1 glycosyl hydrolase family 65 protein [Fervidobacterium sp.]